MRYYEIWYPQQMDENGKIKQGEDPHTTTNIRNLKDLPVGTRIFKKIEDRDGTTIDVEGVEIENGKPVIRGRGIRRARVHWG